MHEEDGSVQTRRGEATGGRRLARLEIGAAREDGGRCVAAERICRVGQECLWDNGGLMPCTEHVNHSRCSGLPGRRRQPSPGSATNKVLPRESSLPISDRKRAPNLAAARRHFPPALSPQSPSAAPPIGCPPARSRVPHARVPTDPHPRSRGPPPRNSPPDDSQHRPITQSGRGRQHSHQLPVPALPKYRRLVQRMQCPTPPSAPQTD